MSCTTKQVWNTFIIGTCIFFLIISKFNTSQISIKVNYYYYKCIFNTVSESTDLEKSEDPQLECDGKWQICNTFDVMQNVVQMWYPEKFITVFISSEDNIHYLTVFIVRPSLHVCL